jgi:hemerythrin-like domain-containing protein
MALTLIKVSGAYPCHSPLTHHISEENVTMKHESIQIIVEEHSALSAMLRSLSLMVRRGPEPHRENFFHVLRAMLFYIDEFPESLHHPKESELLFPPLLEKSPHLAPVIAQLEKDHEKGEHQVRELQHMLLAWELLGDGRRHAFERAVEKYMQFYLEHMRLEESVVLPEAHKTLSAEQWATLDAAFATNCDPLTGKYPPGQDYQGLFTRITEAAPAPIGLGQD